MMHSRGDPALHPPSDITPDITHDIPMTSLMTSFLLTSLTTPPRHHYDITSDLIAGCIALDAQEHSQTQPNLTGQPQVTQPGYT